jgi:hypothetical protein
MSAMKRVSLLLFGLLLAWMASMVAALFVGGAMMAFLAGAAVWLGLAFLIAILVDITVWHLRTSS